MMIKPPPHEQANDERFQEHLENNCDSGCEFCDEVTNMMKYFSKQRHEIMCLCGHWDSKHEEDEQVSQRYVCCECGCDNFQTDYEMMRALFGKRRKKENSRSGRISEQTGT